MFFIVNLSKILSPCKHRPLIRGDGLNIIRARGTDMLQDLKPGDLLVFQLESGFALMRLLGIDDGGEVFHIAVYGDFFPDVESAEAASADLSSISVNSPHLALTARAFESTQVAPIANVPLTAEESVYLDAWHNRADPEISDRSVRLMLGIR
jgi:hypothetical protein